LIAIAADKNAEAIARRSALESLLRNPDDDLLPRLKEWVNDKVVSREAVRGLSYFDGPGISQRLINHWNINVLNRTTAIDSLVARASHASDLLDAIAEGVIPSDAISPYQARQINNLGDDELSNRLKELWGEIRDSPAEKLRELEKWKSILTPQRIASADPLQGKSVFLKQCATCHQLYGDGKKVGPNLTGSDRHNLDYLLGNMIDPSAVVPADYRMSIFLLDDGRVVSGVVAEENDRSLAIETPEGRVDLDKELIMQRKSTNVSLMPEGQLAPLGEAVVSNLVAYLMTSGPIESKAEQE
jgi:putative heme-binding domain-containing protein